MQEEVQDDGTLSHFNLSDFQFGNDGLDDPMAESANEDELVMRKFEDELSRAGFGRVLANGHGEIIICWNAYAVKVCFFLTLCFAV